MATTVSFGPACFQDGPAYSALQLRQMAIASTWYTGGTADALQITSGVINNSTGSMQVLAVSGMNIKVAAGFAVVANSTSASQSGYTTGSMTSSALTVATSDPTNPRIDLVCVTVLENGDSTSVGEVQIITGTPAGSPVAPSLPSNSLSLGTIAVAANASSISQGNITDTRVYTTAAGGVVPWANMNLVTTGHAGLIAYDITNGRFFHNDSTGAKQFKILPWAPVVTIKNTDFNLATSSTSVATASITTDGSTDIKVTAHWVGMFQATPSTCQIVVEIWVDGTKIDEWNGMTNSGDVASTSHLGQTMVYSTSSAAGDTPSAGSHTISVKMWSTYAAGHTVTCHAQAGRNFYLRVEPIVE